MSEQLGLVKKKAESFINQNQGLRRHSDKMSAEIAVLPKYLAIYSAVWRSLQSAKNSFEKKLFWCPQSVVKLIFAHRQRG